jgi:hypothetical protein
MLRRQQAPTAPYCWSPAVLIAVGLYTFGDMIVDMALVNLEVLEIFPTWV